MQHLRTPSSSIYRYIIETGLIPTFKIIRGFESEKKAQKNEAEVEKMYKENGWCILNRAKTGALGGSYIYWTLERCLIVAKFATSMSDFCKRFHGAYASCNKNNWIPQIRQIVTQHVTPKRKTKIWSLDALKNEALKYQRKKDFKANSSSAYNYAKKHKILHPVAWGHHLIRGVFNKDYSLKEKIKFTTDTVSVSQKRNDLINYLEL